jgi:ribosomal subunit interface protein
MEVTFTARGVEVTDGVRDAAERKLAPLGRLEPRATSVELRLIGEHHPSYDGVKHVAAALRVPRKTFRAEAEAGDLLTAIDRVKDKLERQVREHHRRKRPAKQKPGLGYAETQAPAEG